MEKTINWIWFKSSEEGKATTKSIYNLPYAKRVYNKFIKDGLKAEIVPMGYENYAVRFSFD